MAENRSLQNPHAIVIAYPLQGHVIPVVHLAIKLATKGFTITFINTQSIHHQISKSQAVAGDDIFAEARKSGLDIRYTTVTDGLPLGFDRSLNHDQFMECLLHVFSAHVDELVGDIVLRSDPPVTCLIADTFFVWPSTIAEKYKLVNVSFWTEPALVLTLYYHLDLLRENGHFGTRVQELEPETISALNQKQPIYAIGPVFPTGFTKSSVATSLWPESDCTKWLNPRPHGSVLYISFGSYAHTSKHDIVEIANGLLLSGVSFVWVLRPDIVSSDDTDFLPVGFEENIKDQGVIVPWCCQIDVISHPAVGGFLTHCGWNSIFESVWCSVPLLCFPLLTDQFTNRKLVVDDWKVGLNLCEERPVTREEVANKINRLMQGKTSDELRKNTKKMRKTIEEALATDGLSERNFNQFMNDVKVKGSKSNGIGTGI